MVLQEKVYGASGKSLWCFRKKSMVLRFGKRLYKPIYSFRNQVGNQVSNQVGNQAINQESVPQELLLLKTFAKND